MNKPFIICVAIHKGGSHKSSNAGNLGFALGKMGYRVLLIDTDSQKNLSTTYGFVGNDENYNNKNFYELLNHARDDDSPANIYDHILKTDYENVDMIIGSRSLSKSSETLSRMSYAEAIVEEMVEPLRQKKDYDFIIFDTDSTLGTLNTAILQASDGILITLTPSSFGIDGLATFIGHYRRVKKVSKSNVEILGIIFSGIDKREALSIDVPTFIKEYVSEYEADIKVFKTQIPKDININKSQGEKMPLEIAYPSSRAVKAYNDLAKEVIKSVKKR